MSEKVTRQAFVPRYHALLAEARELMGESGENAFRRAKILIQVYEDQDFRANNNVDDFTAADILDSFVADLCLTFLELRAMAIHYTDVETWRAGNLRRMYDDLRRATKHHVEATRPAFRRSIKVAEYERVVSEKEHAEAIASHKTEEMKQLQERCAALETENRQLRAENERLKGRVIQLERTQKRQHEPMYR